VGTPRLSKFMPTTPNPDYYKRLEEMKRVEDDERWIENK
jgi:hypothetical protein